MAEKDKRQQIIDWSCLEIMMKQTKTWTFSRAKIVIRVHNTRSTLKI